MKPRDPAMYGDHHKCNKCQAPSKYIAKETHWCRYCLEIDTNPQYSSMTMEEIDQLRMDSIAALGLKAGHSIMPKNTGTVGF